MSYLLKNNYTFSSEMVCREGCELSDFLSLVPVLQFSKCALRTFNVTCCVIQSIHRGVLPNGGERRAIKQIGMQGQSLDDACVIAFHILSVVLMHAWMEQQAKYKSTCASTGDMRDD